MAYANPEDRRAYYRQPRARATANAYQRKLRLEETPSQRAMRLKRDGQDRRDSRPEDIRFRPRRVSDIGKSSILIQTMYPRVLAKKRAYYKTDKFKELHAKWGRKYLSVPKNRIANCLRVRVRCAMKTRAKSGSTITLLGCSIEQLMQHLQSQFKPGMAWNNYGKHGWHIDHIKPCAAFNLLDAEEQRKCFHYSNLQPLWEHENLTKHCKLIYVKAP